MSAADEEEALPCAPWCIDHTESDLHGFCHSTPFLFLTDEEFTATGTFQERVVYLAENDYGTRAAGIDVSEVREMTVVDPRTLAAALLRAADAVEAMDAADATGPVSR